MGIRVKKIGVWLDGSSPHLEVVALGDGAEDADSDGGDEKSAEDGLDEDGVLDLAESRLLDPDLTVKHLPHDIALLVAGDPWLVFPRVARRVRVNALEGVRLEVVALRLVIGSEELPWSQPHNSGARYHLVAT